MILFPAARILVLALLASAPAPALASQAKAADAVVCRGDSKPELTDAQILEACGRVIAMAEGSARVEALGLRARALLNLERLDEALVDVTAALKLAPADEDALLLRGTIHYDQDADDLALADYNTVLARNPGSVAALYERGLVWQYGLPDAAKARADYDAVLTAKPDHFLAILQRGILLSEDDPTAALKDFDHAVALRSDHARARRNRALLYDTLKQPEKALSEFGVILRRHPDDVLTLTARAYLHADRGDYGPALKDADRAVTLDRDGTDGLLARGYIQEVAKQPDAAAQAYEAVLKITPTHAYSLLHLARIYRHQDHTDLALARIDTLLRLNPKNTDGAFERALILTARKEPDKAMAQYDALIAASPTAEALYNRAMIWSDTGDHKAALADFERAAALDPKDPEILLSLGYEQNQLGFSDLAMRAYDAALVLKPDYAQVMVNRGIILAERKDWSGAVAAYERALKSGPDRADLHISLGEIRDEQGDQVAALDEYARALKLDPKSQTAWVNRAEVLRGMGRFREAIAAYDAVLTVYPDDLELMVGRARVRRDKGDKAGALADLDAALKIAPASAYVRNSRGLYYWNNAENLLAIAEFDKAVAIDSKYEAAYYNRSLALLDEGRYDRAIRDINISLRLSPDDIDSLSQKGEIYRHMEDYLRAVDLLDLAIKADPENARSWFRRGLAKEALGDAAGAAADKAQAKRLDPKIS